MKKVKSLTGSASILNQPDFFGSGTTTGFDMWSWPSLVETKEVGETIEFIYKQTQNSSYSIPYPTFNVRVFKIVFSCKDGKWNKSEPIYGEIISAQEESYEFK